MGYIRMNYSVLMSVYHKENPDYLRLAMESIWNQTVPTNDFVLVCDGPLSSQLNLVIAETKKKHQELHIIRLEKNGGLGNALNIGIKQCKNELIARMDSDDISRPERCEKQINIFEKKKDISIVGGIIEEFSTSKEQIESRRITPETQSDILKYAKKRNPFNHPTVMYKKQAVESAGGYQDFYLLEDYFLWIRMLYKGFLGYNIQEPLLWMRGGSELCKRRSGWKYALSQRKLFSYMREIGFITLVEFFFITSCRMLSSLSPNWIRGLAYKLLLRKKPQRQEAYL